MQQLEHKQLKPAPHKLQHAIHYSQGQHQNQGKAVEHPVDIMFLLEQAAIRRINGTVVGKRSAKYTL